MFKKRKTNDEAQKTDEAPKTDETKKVMDEAAAVADKMRELDWDTLLKDQPIGKLMLELMNLYRDEQIEGMFVAVVRPDGRIYPHVVGRTDNYRLLGVMETFMRRELANDFERDFIGRAWKGVSQELRRELEKGV